MTAVPLLEDSPPEESLYGKHRQPAVRSSARVKDVKPRAEGASGSDYTQSTAAVKGNNLIQTMRCFVIL
jgi:hypothetical protein